MAVPPTPAFSCPSGAPESQSVQDSEKSRQILSGAREVFLTQGFDGASMGEIARVAGVSKGTLYFYFASKQALFEALVHEECTQTAERVVVFDNDEPDLRAALMNTGRSYVQAMTRPEHIATVRTVIAIGEKFPEIGRTYLSSGLQTGVARLSAWFSAKIARGELRMDNPELAAWQFLVSCHAPIVMPVLFGGEAMPHERCVDDVVAHVVDMFLRAFQPGRQGG
ncbi:TetR/AcrR family transcriptional regulator [Bosea sp. 117]|uniref:TetR/AcrR family transcriptional regulator n=1 Tax=Bosea sp. 117 TaxID=1125973 RepID=UPI00069051D1|nr:TetR/AcrR family transcriptional regulator [Bosea sp. 117]